MLKNVKFIDINSLNQHVLNILDQTSRSNLVGRSIEIYSHLNAALKPLDPKCVEKITCEVGSLASDAGLTQNSEGSISNIVFT